MIYSCDICHHKSMTYLQRKLRIIFGIYVMLRQQIIPTTMPITMKFFDNEVLVYMYIYKYKCTQITNFFRKHEMKTLKDLYLLTVAQILLLLCQDVQTINAAIYSLREISNLKKAQQRYLTIIAKKDQDDLFLQKETTQFKGSVSSGLTSSMSHYDMHTETLSQTSLTKQNYILDYPYTILLIIILIIYNYDFIFIKRNVDFKMTDKIFMIMMHYSFIELF